MKFLQIYNCW